MKKFWFVPHVFIFGLLCALLAGCNLVITPPAANPPAAAQPAVAIAGEFETVQLIIDFAPGSWTPNHVHGGTGLITVVEGEITLRRDGVETLYKAGEGWIEHPNMLHAAGNAGASPARLSAVFLLPKGAILTTPQKDTSGKAPPPPPTITVQTRQAVSEPLGEFEVVQLIFDFIPGAWTPIHEHGGTGVITVLNGDITLRRDGAETLYTTGKGWIEHPNMLHAAGNAGASPAQLSAVFLLPKGAILTTPQKDTSGKAPPPAPKLLMQARLAVNSTK